MGFALKRIANGEWRVFRDGQSIGCGKRSPDVTTRVALHLGVVFEPKEEALFKLATKRLPNRGSRARLVARNPARNGAAAILNRSMPSTAGATISLLPAQAVNEVFQRPVRPRYADIIYNTQEQYTRWGAAFPGNFVPMFMIGGKCACFRAKIVEISGHLPRASRELGTGQTTGGLGEAPGSFASTGGRESQTAPPDARV